MSVAAAIDRRALLGVALLPLGLATELLALLELLIAPRVGVGHAMALLGLHLFSATVLAEALLLRYPAGSAAGRQAWRLALAFAVALPLFGVVLASIFVARPPRAIRVSVGAADEIVSPMEHRKQQAEAQLASEAGQATADVDVEAIGEALKDQDKAKRLGAIEALRALENKEAIAMLGQSLKNTVFEVRFHAVEALAGINKKYSDRIAKASAAVERESSASNHLALADIYHEYASLEAEEESIQQHLHRSAASHYRKALDAAAQLSPSHLSRLAVSLVRTGDLQQARRAYNAALRADPDFYDALVGLAGLQFSDRQYDQLRETCRRLLELPGVDPKATEVFRLWGQGQ